MTRTHGVLFAALLLGCQATSWAVMSGGAEARLPPRLSETGLYAPGRPDVIDPRNRPFSPQYPLWSDGAAKARWVFLPPGAAIDGSDAAEWDFPVGTRFWKEFTFGGRKIETRLLWKAAEGRWIAASYAWNAHGTDAVLVPREGAPEATPLGNGRTHAIPSRDDCFACHGALRPGPLGFNVLQLSTDRDPNAIHAEPLAPGMITLKTLVEEELLSPAPSHLLDAPPRIPARTPRTRAVLGYLSANCGGCHNGEGEISVTGPSLKHGDVLREGEVLERAMAAHRTKWQAPGVADGETLFVDPRVPDSSALLLRMRSRRPSSQMPPLGTVLRDERAIAAIRAWIAEDLRRSAAHADADVGGT